MYQLYKLIFKLAPLSFVVYLGLLVKLILLKNPKQFFNALQQFKLSNIDDGIKHLQLIPLKTTWSCLSGERTLTEAVENIGGNMVGFIPMGILLPILFSKLKTGKQVVITVCCISIAFELIQFVVGVGYCDIDDILQNTLGGMIGWWLYKKCLLPYKSSPKV